MNFYVILVGVMSTCSCVTIVFILSYFIVLCFNKKLRHFQATIYSTLFFSDILAIISMSLVSTTSDLQLCMFSQGLFQLSSNVFFLFSSSLVFTVLTLVKRENTILFQITDTIQYKVGIHLFIWIICVTLAVASTLTNSFDVQKYEYNISFFLLFFLFFSFLFFFSLFLLFFLPFTT